MLRSSRRLNDTDTTADVPSQTDNLTTLFISQMGLWLCACGFVVWIYRQRLNSTWMWTAPLHMTVIWCLTTDSPHHPRDRQQDTFYYIDWVQQCPALGVFTLFFFTARAVKYHYFFRKYKGSCIYLCIINTFQLNVQLLWEQKSETSSFKYTTLFFFFQIFHRPPNIHQPEEFLLLWEWQ